MEQEKIVLPKFTVPGQTNWVKWALVGVGGMVALSVIAFTVALSQRDTDGATAREEPAPAKPADVPLAPSATPRPVPRPSTTLAATTTPAPETSPEAAEPPRRVKASSHRPRRARGSSRSLAKTSSNSSKSGKPDALDEILKRFK